MVKRKSKTSGPHPLTGWLTAASICEPLPDDVNSGYAMLTKVQNQLRYQTCNFPKEKEKIH